MAVRLLCLPPAAFVQPMPTGPHLSDLADRAGLLIGVRTYGIDAEYNAMVEREFNAGTCTNYPRWDAKHSGIGQ